MSLQTQTQTINNPIILKKTECLLFEPKKLTVSVKVKPQCGICLEPVKFPVSHGCCTFICCKNCHDNPLHNKSNCPGCRGSISSTMGTAWEEFIRQPRDFQLEVLETNIELLSIQVEGLNDRIDIDAERHLRQCARIDRDAERHRDQCARITSLSISLEEKTLECAMLSSMLDANVSNIDDIFYDALQLH